VRRRLIRKEPTEVVDFSGRWNDTDARMACRRDDPIRAWKRWAGRIFKKKKGRDPVVIVGTIANRSP